MREVHTVSVTGEAPWSNRTVDPLRANRDGTVWSDIVLPWALGQFASPDLLSSRLVAAPLSSNGHVLGRLQRSTYIQVRLALQAPSGLVWLATCPSAGSKN